MISPLSALLTLLISNLHLCIHFTLNSYCQPQGPVPQILLAILNIFFAFAYIVSTVYILNSLDSIISPKNIQSLLN